MAAGVRSVKIRFSGDAKDLTRAARQASDAVSKVGKGVASAAGSLASGIGSALSTALDMIPPMGKPVAGLLVAGLASQAAPAIGAAISSGVLLGLGGGILALGIKSAADSPQVKAAFKGLKKTAGGVFEDFGTPFEKPLARLAASIGRTLISLAPQITGLGKIMAPVVDKIGPALDGFAKAAMPGITKAVESSVPLFNTLFEKLPKIGESIGVFFTKIAEQGPAAQSFFGDMLDAISWIIEALGTVIGWLASFYKSVRDNVKLAYMAFLELKVKLFGVFGDILAAARSSLSWIPGLDSKLAVAEAKFAQLARDANAELAKIRDSFRVTISAYFKTAAYSGPNVGGFTPRASGGPVRAGGLFRVGEHGPELIRMAGNGFVHNARETAQMQDGGTTEIHVHLADDVTRVLTFANRDLKRRARSRSARFA